MIDLHMHSMFSDGTYTPEELIEAGMRSGVTAMALTDHDTLAGVPRFLAAATKAGLKVYTGVEVSADCDAGSVHILGYGVDPAHLGFQQALAWIREGRHERNQEILKKLNGLGLRLTYAEVTSHAGADVVARPHFALAMMAKGYVSTKREAFDRYLARGKPAYAERRRFGPGECFQLIREAGGVPVLAHPFTLRQNGQVLRKTIEVFKAEGMAGLEVYYPEHSPEMQRICLELCREFDLVATGGSDFHGAVSPGVGIGRGFGPLLVPDTVVDALDARLTCTGT